MKSTKRIPLSPDLEDAFGVRVQRDEETGCLLWMGQLNRQGYGILRHGGDWYFAHRESSCLHHGVSTFPDGLVPDHLFCGVPPCVEWSHLEAVPVAVNTQRGRSPQLTRERRLRTQCRQGHPLVAENLILATQKSGIRQRCRICVNVRQRTDMKQYRHEHAEVCKVYRLRNKKPV